VNKKHQKFLIIFTIRFTSMICKREKSDLSSLKKIMQTGGIS